MRVQINITFTDDTPEEVLIVAGSSQAKLCEFYTEAFANLLTSIEVAGIKKDLHVVVSDNTKEEENHGT